VVDTSRDPKILPLLKSSGFQYQILYGKQLATTMDGFGPHLVALPSGMPFPVRLLEEGWGHNWGIVLSSPADFMTVRRQLRRLLYIRLSDGRPALFRFYDPRVLRNYLPCCSEVEIERLFGSIHSIYFESITGKDLCVFSKGAKEVAKESRPATLLRESSFSLTGGDRYASNAP
jgi:hypothetical protein